MTRDVSEQAGPGLPDWLVRNADEIRAALAPVAFGVAAHRGQGLEETVRDLYVEVSKRMLEKGEAIDAGRPPLGRLMRYAQNIGLQWRDAASRERRRTEPIGRTEPGDDGAQVKQWDNRILADAALGALAGRDRRLVELFVLEGRGAAEVGETLDMSAGAVRVAWHRIKTGLRERFAAGE